MSKYTNLVPFTSYKQTPTTEKKKIKSFPTYHQTDCVHHHKRRKRTHFCINPTWCRIGKSPLVACPSDSEGWPTPTPLRTVSAAAAAVEQRGVRGGNRRDVAGVEKRWGMKEAAEMRRRAAGAGGEWVSEAMEGLVGEGGQP